MPGWFPVKVGEPTAGVTKCRAAAPRGAVRLCVQWRPLARLPGWPRLLLCPLSFAERMNDSMDEQMLPPVRRLLPWGQDRRPHQLAVRTMGRQRGSPVPPAPPQGHLSADRVPEGARAPQRPSYI